MTPQQFIEKFREAFGEAAPLPIAFWYGNTAVNAESRFKEMLTTMSDSALYQKAFSVVKRRINGEIG